MEAFLIISFFFLAVLGIGLWVVTQSRSRPVSLPPNNLSATFTASPPGRALFNHEESLAAFLAEETERAKAEQRAALFARAENGDFAVLEAADDDVALYRELLNALAASTPLAALPALIRYVLQHGEWRVTPALTNAALTHWQADAASLSVGELLHLAALSDEAACFQQAVETTLQHWRTGQLARVTPNNLQALIEGEYWLLAPEARNSGNGFLLKQMLVAARRELAAVAQHASATTVSE